MEHEVFVPFPAETVRRALADRDRVARCVPGLQSEGAETGPDVVSGRLRVRIGASTITYRGALRVTPHESGAGAGPGAAADSPAAPAAGSATGSEADSETGGGVPGFTVEGEGSETRGTGTVKVALEIGIEDAESGGLGTLLTFVATARADGRLAEFDEGVAAAVGRRLLDRFVAGLVTDLPVAMDLVDDAGLPDEVHDLDNIDVIEVVELDVELPEIPESAAELDPLLPGDEPPAEAAHARRTMIGRSAEEVDHAPPRGRYAPVPAPRTGSAAATLRWAVPAAVVLLASAVVVGRVLRRRR